jgi:acyl-CoA synthetase (AMP-forming)/AMP-acid ligase II
MRGNQFRHRSSASVSVSDKTIDTPLDDQRTSALSRGFVAKASVTDQTVDGAAAADHQAFWWRMATSGFMSGVDDVRNVAGHRISTAGWTSALVDHPAVAEAAVVAKSDPETGQAISPFVTLRSGYEESTRDIAENRKLGRRDEPCQTSIVAYLQRRATEEESKEQ